MNGKVPGAPRLHEISNKEAGSLSTIRPSLFDQKPRGLEAATAKAQGTAEAAAANAALGEAHIGGKQHQTKRYAKAGAHRSKTQKSAHGSPGSRRGKMTVQPAQSPEDRPVLPPLPSGSRSCKTWSIIDLAGKSMQVCA